MMSEHWPRGTLVTRLYEGDSFALSLIRLSGETRAHRSRTTLRFVYVGLQPRSGSARPAILTVRRLLYSNGFLPPFSSAEFCSAYLTLGASGRGGSSSPVEMLTVILTGFAATGRFGEADFVRIARRSCKSSCSRHHRYRRPDCLIDCVDALVFLA